MTPPHKSRTRFQAPPRIRHSWDYDPLGNITQWTNHLISWDFDYTYAQTGNAGPHAVTNLESVGSYSYDGNGNQTSRPGGDTLSFDAANRLVFYGDSITDAWAEHFDAMFPGKPYVGRGISGQTTPQMLVRFRQDVIDLTQQSTAVDIKKDADIVIVDITYHRL